MINDIRGLSVFLCNWRVTVRVLSTAKISRRCERALMRFEGKLAGMKHRASYRSWDEACIEREYYIDQGLTMRYEGGRVGGGGRIGEARMMSPIIPWNTWAPRSPSRAGPARPRSPLRVARARKCMKTSTHSPSPASAKLHDLRVLSAPKLFPANHKNSPSPPANPLILHPARLPQFSASLHFLG